MRWYILVAIQFFTFNSCKLFTHKIETEENQNRVVLRTDTINTVKLSDTLIIFESVCRGCAYEQSTDFVLYDSLHLVELSYIETHDNNSENMTGGSISKNLIIIPKQIGTTSAKVYTFLQSPGSKEDSANYNSYYINIIN